MLKHLVGVSLLLPLTTLFAAEEPLDIAATYQRITADYQRLAATPGSAAQVSSARLAKDAYRLLLADAKSVATPSIDDLYALGACHEALGDAAAARDSYTKSLAEAPSARTYLSLARLSVTSDPVAAEKQFAEAVKLQPDHPEIGRIRLALAAAYARQRAWAQTVTHLDKHLIYTNSLLDRQPGNRALISAHETAQRELDRARRFVAMTGKPAPAIKVSAWAQGSATDLAGLKGKVVVLDFLALWAESSRHHVDGLKGLADMGVEVVALSRANHHEYDEATDSVTVVDDLSLEAETAGLAAFAKKHGLPFRLAIVEGETTEQYGVTNLPHVVILDKSGNVSAILLGEQSSGDEFDKAVAAAAK